MNATQTQQNLPAYPLLKKPVFGFQAKFVRRIPSRVFANQTSLVNLAI